MKLLPRSPAVLPLVIALLLAFAGGRAGAQTCALAPAGASVALSSQEIAKLGNNHSIDASISTFRAGGAQYWILPLVRLQAGKAFVSHALTKGPPGDIDAGAVGEWDEPTLFGNAPGMKWITNTYQDKDGVLAFVHTEYALPGEVFGGTYTDKDGQTKKLPGPGHSRIGLAWYPNPDPERRAPKFTYLGHIIGAFGEMRFPAWNVHGTPYVIRRDGGEDWFYIYFFDAPVKGQQGHIATARAKVADVLRDAKAGKAGAWQKFNNGQWTAGLGGPSSPMTAEHTIAHSDAAQAAGGRFFLATTRMNGFRGSDIPSAIVVYESCDAVTWKEMAREQPVTLPAKDGKGRINPGWQYVTILDPSGTDNGRFGTEMEMLVGFQYNKPDREVRRLLYRLQGDCSCPVP